MEVDANVAKWLDAIRTGSYSDARQLLRDDQDVNVRGMGGRTALHVVVACHNPLKTVKKLLLDGADPHLTDDFGHTPLCITQRLNRVAVVECLIYHDALLRELTARLRRKPVHADVVAMMQHKRMRHFRESVRLRVEEKSLELITAARKGDLEAVWSIVENEEIAIDAVDAATGETAFSAALAAGRKCVYEYLLTKDSHLYAPCIVEGSLQSVLTTAASRRDVDFVRRLVAHGAMLTVPDVPTMDSHTCPLAEAVKSGSMEMVDALLDLGARAAPRRHGLQLPWSAREAFTFNLGIGEDITPWWLLAMASWQQDANLIDHLCKTQVVLSDRLKMAKHGAPALFLAALQESAHIVADLLDRGVSINQPISKGVTAGVAAVAVNSTSMLQFLLARGADAGVLHTGIIAFTGLSEGLLATALHAGAMDCAQILLPMETRPEHLDQALYIAAKRGDVDFATSLLNISRPSTLHTLRTAVSRTSCPLLLDLLLSRCCVDGGGLDDVSKLNDVFANACRSCNADFLSVFLAYGININHRCERDKYPPLKTALVLNESSGVAVATTLIENGIELVSEAKSFSFWSLLDMVGDRLRHAATASERAHYTAGCDLLIAHSVHHVA